VREGILHSVNQFITFRSVKRSENGSGVSEFGDIYNSTGDKEFRGGMHNSIVG